MFVSLCYNGDTLLGHAFFLKKTLHNGETCTWVTQLVVHHLYRSRGIGTRLLQSAWGFSNYFAWGLATANALTIKALESATWREVVPSVIEENIDIISALSEDISFAKGAHLQISEHCSQIDSKFFPIQEEHSYNPIYVERLGALQDGYEWLAFTFRSQDMVLDTKHFESMLNFSQSQLLDAYNRMEMSEHPWTRHTRPEVDFIEKNLSLKPNMKILDIGCGQGRHAIEFAQRGYIVYGVDNGTKLLEFARKEAEKQLSKTALSNIRFDERDCRKRPYHCLFDVVLCLYDVIGSYRNDKDNKQIMDVVASKLRKGGKAVVSVMNMELTKSLATQRNNVRKHPDTLLKLPASNIMQKTGNIFNPDFFLLDEENHLVYRKEQFEQDGMLSSEYVIADYRYTMNEIVENFQQRGMRILKAQYVQAGHWDQSLEACDSKAKEILLLLEKE